MPLCLDEKKGTSDNARALKEVELVSVAPCRPLQFVHTAEPQTPPPSIAINLPARISSQIDQNLSNHLKSVQFFLGLRQPEWPLPRLSPT